MRLFIPKVGDVLTLSESWTFIVWSESRNEKLGTLLGVFDKTKHYREARWKGQENSEYEYKGVAEVASTTCTLPEDTQLKIDRLYVRKGVTSECNSVSFFIYNHPNKKFNKVRFWAKLEDVNNIIFNTIGDTE